MKKVLLSSIFAINIMNKIVASGEETIRTCTDKIFDTCEVHHDSQCLDLATKVGEPEVIDQELGGHVAAIYNKQYEPLIDKCVPGYGSNSPERGSATATCAEGYIETILYLSNDCSGDQLHSEKHTYGECT